MSKRVDWIFDTKPIHPSEGILAYFIVKGYYHGLNDDLRVDTNNLYIDWAVQWLESCLGAASA